MEIIMTDDQPLVPSPTSAAPGSAAPPTDEVSSAPGRDADLVKREPRRAGSKSGKAGKRHVALMPLGVDLCSPSLKTHEDRLRVLESVAHAVATGKCSGLTATTLVSIVREARAEANADLEVQLDSLTAKVESLIAAGTIRI
jgi:hypothetical protein